MLEFIVGFLFEFVLGYRVTEEDSKRTFGQTVYMTMRAIIIALLLASLFLIFLCDVLGLFTAGA